MKTPHTLPQSDPDKTLLAVGGIIDIETTGISPVSDEIVEFAIVLFRYNRETGELVEVVEEYTGLNEPSKPIPKAASNIHGLYDQHVKGHSLDLNKLNQLINQVDILIAHNATFNLGFVKKILPLAETKPWYCTMHGIKWTSYGFSTRKLHDLAREHKISVEHAHRALDDALYAINLLGIKNPKGVFYLAELLQATPANRVSSKEHEHALVINRNSKKKGHAAFKLIILLLVLGILAVLFFILN